MQTKSLALTLILVAVASILVADAILHFSLSIPNRARIKGVGVSIWWDPTATQPVDYIDWDMLEPNETKTTPLYFQSKSNVNITLTMTTTNWNPPNASNYIKLTWNYIGTPLTPKAVTPIDLTLHVAWNITDIDNFTFDIIVTAQG